MNHINLYRHTDLLLLSYSPLYKSHGFYNTASFPSVLLKRLGMSLQTQIPRSALNFPRLRLDFPTKTSLEIPET